MATARGILRTALKSASVSVRPMPSMMTARPQVIQWPLNQVNQAGCASASAPPSKTQTGNRFVARGRMRFMDAWIKREFELMAKAFLLGMAVLREIKVDSRGI